MHYLSDHRGSDYYFITLHKNILISPVASGTWVSASGGVVPDGAVIGGVDSHGAAMFVARARIEDCLVPGKLVANFGFTLIPWFGKEIAINQYEVLIDGPNRWVPCRGKTIPGNAFPGGVEKNGVKLYICRARIQGSLTVGKMHSERGTCYLCYGGAEHSFTEYELLVDDGIC
ncbi:uncharacterized protein LOC142987600 [Anticarsia gemmatalis]|uniref:uncharacterized protein LOC142987600 n=1 Tax=Anticarsia gemmatalis TaxID=129554 RepID=UPI003F75BEA4